jgi:hypothetical protein
VQNGTSHSRSILLRIETKAGDCAGKPVTKEIEELRMFIRFCFGS